MHFHLILGISTIVGTALAAPAVENVRPMLAIEHQGLGNPLNELSNMTEVQNPKGDNQTQYIKEKTLRIMPLGGK